MTIDEFIAGRDELPDGGQWVELIDGEVKTLYPPTIEHGNAVLNIGKSLAKYVQSGQGGYACFELGFATDRGVNTVLYPAISFFASGPMFAESDKAFTENRPDLVIELASTNDRRRGMEQRVAKWLAWGVPLVWVVDPQTRQVHVVEKTKGGRRLGEEQELTGEPVL